MSSSFIHGYNLRRPSSRCRNLRWADGPDEAQSGLVCRKKHEIFQQGMNRYEKIWRVLKSSHLCWLHASSKYCSETPYWSLLHLSDWFSWAWGVNNFNSLPSPAIEFGRLINVPGILWIPSYTVIQWQFNSMWFLYVMHGFYMLLLCICTYFYMYDIEVCVCVYFRAYAPQPARGPLKGKGWAAEHKQGWRGNQHCVEDSLDRMLSSCP